MKKLTLAVFAWALVSAMRGAFAVLALEDETGKFEIGGDAGNANPAEDYADGIYTQYNSGSNYAGLELEYKGYTVYQSSHTPNNAVRGYLIQSVCSLTSAAGSGIASCNIVRNHSGTELNYPEWYCWCRLKRISDNVNYAGWVYYGSLSGGANCATKCANECVSSTDASSSAFVSALLSAFAP
ncbi:MAG: hypothetical protein LBJ73_00820 [Rickettsiales bacterium]|nr:hypothetical protein [Rickettsiales bacterium]